MAGAFAALPRARPTVWGQGGAAFGAASLPLTPEDRLDHQPRTARGGQVDFLFAGRLNNRADLAGALEIGAADLAGMADGTLALRGFERWGEAWFARLSGSWSLVVWDRAARRLTMARDPLGGRALFFHRAGGVVTFASSFGALFRLPRIERVLDEVVLGDALLLSFGERDRTYYRDIRRVPGGHRVVCTVGEVEVSAFWQPPEGDYLRLARDEDYVEAARELFDRAVAANLRSLEPVAMFGSGGLDSSAVSATAARMLAPRMLKHYCRVPPAGWHGPLDPSLYPDERPKLRALAARYPNLQVIEIDDAGLHPLDLDPRGLFQRYCGPFSSGDNLGWLMVVLDRIRADGHRVILSGEFGNDTLTAAGFSAPMELLGELRFGALARELVAWRRRFGWSWGRTLKNALLSHCEPSGLRRWRLDRRAPGGRRYLNWSLINPDFVGEAGLEARSRALGLIAFGPMGRSWRALRAEGVRQTGRLAGDFLSQSVAVDGFEERAPLGDLPLLEFCLKVPATQYCRNAIHRWLGRRVLADRLPPEITGELWLGAQNPEWFDRRSQMRAETAAELVHLARSPLAARILDLPRAARLLDSWPADAQSAHEQGATYRLALGRGLHIARFIRWNDGGNE